MTFSPQQRLVKRVVPARLFESFERDTRGWVVEGDCGQSRNLWEAGGIRWKARGEKTVMGYCTKCAKRHRFTIRRISADMR